MNIEELKLVVTNEIDRCRELTRHIASFQFPEVTYDLKGRTFGMAWGHRKIQVNVDIALAIGPGYRRTVAHEYAHLITDWLCHHNPRHKLLAGDTKGGHGRGWRNVMAFMGEPTERCAPEAEVRIAALAGSVGKTYRYTCVKGCCESFFSQRRHNVVVRGGGRYLGRNCKGVLFYKPE